MNWTLDRPTRRTALAGATAAVLSRAAYATAPRPPDRLVIGGTGAALGTMRRLADAFRTENPGVVIEIPNSLGTTGGLRAVLSGAIDVAAATRSATPQEHAAGARSVAYGRSAFGFFTSHPRPPSDMTLEAMTEIYALARRSWGDGTPIRLILRTRSDGDSMYLAERFPKLGTVLDATHARQLVPVAQTDQANLDLAEKLEGSFASSTFAAVISEERRLKPIALDGVMPDVASVENGSYPHVRTLHLVTAPSTSEAGHAFVAFACSPRAHRILAGCGSAPALG